jgi:6-pyruvoyltetrahydropterin/6-carboxytetrahydropterin synthase
MMTITKKYTFEYAHVVRGAYSERCKYNIHGHSGVVEVTLAADKLDDSGMVLDFGHMQMVSAVIDLLDHATLLWELEDQEVKDFFLNNFRRVVIMSVNTTAENIAAAIFHYIHLWLNATSAASERGLHVESVTVHETARGKATCHSYDDLALYSFFVDVKGDHREGALHTLLSAYSSDMRESYKIVGEDLQ